ncbi:MAG: hypothetical protein FJW66_01520, partial [Actinobacteria bacterium]|nr:hypothetical protein [Actinomycetota bacterium]
MEFLTKKSFSSGQVLLILLIFILIFSAVLFTGGCRAYDDKFDVAYFFKTEPEKAALDFLYAMENKDAEYIYSNLLLDRDRRSISREKFISEMTEIFSDIESIDVIRIVYLGYENEMSKVVLEFEVKYSSGDLNKYKKYIYLKEE